MASTEKKRKRVVLTIEEKVKVLDMLDKSVSYFHTLSAQRGSDNRGSTVYSHYKQYALFTH